MSSESQEQKLPAADHLTRRIFGKEQRMKSRDPSVVHEILVRRGNGESIDKIAKTIKCHRNTVMSILNKNGGDPLERVGGILRDGLPKIADMVIIETLRKKDVRAGVALLQGAGQLESLRPKPSVESGGRIVIEWNGAPPPWAPAPVLKAYAERAALPVAPIADAEVVSDAENSKAGE